jgi:hypothetical protein
MIRDSLSGIDGCIWSRGGNALITSDDPTQAERRIWTWSRKQLEQTPGLQFTAVHRPYQESELARAFGDGLALLDIEDGKAPFGNALGALPVHSHCPSTGKIASYWHKRLGWCSAEAIRKEEEADLDVGGPYRFPEELAQLGTREGAAHIAIVHLDGNDIGKMLQGFCEQAAVAKNQGRFLKQLDEVSQWIERSFETAKDEWLADLKELRGDLGLTKPSSWDNPPYWMPVRPIVWAGDERTFVLPGFLGLSAAADLLRRVVDVSRRNPPIGIPGLPGEITACAGIAIVPQKFPFSRAFALAEELTASAKRQRLTEADGEGSFLDFEILREGSSGSLKQYRETQVQARLLGKPYRIGKSWSAFVERWRELTEPKKDDDGRETDEPIWARSRLKRLLEAFPKGPVEVRSLLQEFNSRGLRLNSESDHYFRPLDALDHFIDIDWQSREVNRRVQGGNKR